MHKVAMEAIEETPAGVGLLEPPEPAAQTPTGPRLALDVQATMPAAGAGAGTTVGSLLFGLASNFDGASQELLATRVTRDDRDDNSSAPEVVAKGASSGNAPAAVAESCVGSLSSASRLQQEWVDTASSADVGGKLMVQGSKPNLAGLDKQFSVVKESLQNIGFQLLDAIRMTNVSTASLASDFFCWLRDMAHSFAVHFAIHPSPRVSR
jgi:hypothetical protein